MMYPTPSDFLVLLAAVTITRAALVNVTVDDENGDERTKARPTYTPDGNWRQGASCDGCKAKPDPSQAFDGTWHDVTHESGEQMAIEFNFTGSAVYVFFILANNLDFVTTLTNVSFSLDGSDVGTFVHSPDKDTPSYQYNATAFAISELENVEHALMIHTNGEEKSLVLFDYLIYTVEEDDNTSSSASQTSATAWQAVSGTSLQSLSLSSSSPSTKTAPNGLSSSFEHSSLFFSSTSALTSSSSSSSSLLSFSSQSSPTSSAVQSSSSKERSTGAVRVVGSVVGGLAILVFAMLFFVCMRKRKGRDITLDSSASVPSIAKRKSGTESSASARNRFSFGAVSLTSPLGSRSRTVAAEGVEEKRLASCGDYQHSLPPSIYGYGVGLHTPTELQPPPRRSEILGNYNLKVTRQVMEKQQAVARFLGDADRCPRTSSPFSTSFASSAQTSGRRV